MMLCADGGTSIKIPYFLQTKDAMTTLAIFHKFRTMAEKQTGHVLLCVQFDKGREFDNKLFIHYLETNGIRYEKIPKDSSAQNGVVERGNRTVIAGGRTQMEDAHLGHEWWAESAASHCYVHGFIPSARHPGKVPWQQWFNWPKPPNISHLRRWGSNVWVKDLDGVEGKLGRQGWKGVMVGYMDCRGYRIFDVTRRAVYEVRDVVFEEGESHRTQPSKFDVELDNRNVDISTNEPSSLNPDQPAVSDQLPVPDQLQVSDQTRPDILNSTPDAPAIPATRRRRFIPDPNVPLRRSERVQQPTQAMLESIASRERESIAVADKADWATDSVHPTSNLIDAIDPQCSPSRLLEDFFALASVAKETSIPIPKSYEQAMRNAEFWMPAMEKEIRTLEERGVWELVDLPEGAHCVSGMWVYDLKMDGSGNVIAPKARYVGRGDSQKEGVDYEKGWAMVTRMESV